MPITIRGSSVLIGASLSEPHTSELHDAIFIFCRMYSVCIPYVCLDCNLTQPRAACGLYVALQTTFQHARAVLIHSFPMGEDGEERRLGGVAGTRTFTVRRLQVVKTPWLLYRTQLAAEIL